MLQAIWTAGSLRLWIALALAAAVLPLAVSALLGYFMLSHGVIASFEAVSHRQSDQLEPTHHASLLLWAALFAANEYVETGEPNRLQEYRQRRQEIENVFAELLDNLGSEREVHALVARARDDWVAADRLATETMSVRQALNDRQTRDGMHRVHGLVAAAIDRLDAFEATIERGLERDHRRAELYFERAEWVAGIAAAASLLSILTGLYFLGRMLTNSVDRLVEGAARFAAGDRSHRIEVRVPPELHLVAEEFNRMIGRIHESESALAEQARHDALTLLPNRRAFDEAMAEALARVERLGEGMALLALDIDHFKHVNDTYGHSSGDDVLRAVAQAMAADVRVFDRVFRTGGEEFAVLLSAVDAATAHQTAERLRLVVAALSIPVEGAEIGVTISIGIAMATSAMDAEALVEAADAALYSAKTQGRNRVVVSGADHKEAGRQP